VIKRTQNIVAESRYALPLMIVYAITVWIVSRQLFPAVPLTSGTLMNGAWVQFACFLLSAYLVVEFNNSNALIRIYSPMVSCSFIALSCAACFLFGSMSGAIVQLCGIAAYICLFRTYQDKTAMGWTFYTFLCVSLASMAKVQILCFVPLLWGMMFFLLTSLSWRTFAASLLGLLTPYWLVLPFAFYQEQSANLVSHFAALAEFQMPYAYTHITLNQLLLFALVVALALTGIIHYWRNSYNDSIRIRQFYSCFIVATFAIIIFLVLQPQHFDMLMRLLIISVAPLIAHFLSLTHTRVTNIAFFVITAVTVLLTILNLWTPSLRF